MPSESTHTPFQQVFTPNPGQDVSPPTAWPTSPPSGANAIRSMLQTFRARAVTFGTALTERFLLRRQIERFYLVLGGHIFFQTLSAAVQLDLFTLLSRHRRLTGPEIADHLGIGEKPARILLLGCTSLGLIRKVGKTYSNTWLSEQQLNRDRPGNITSIVEWQHHINYRPLHHFFEAIKQNRNVGLHEFEGDEATLYGRLTHNPQLERIFQNAMEAISVQANQLLARFVDFSHVTHVVDVGGGNGANVIALAKKYPKLRASVFDAPSVCAVAQQNIEAAHLAERLNTVAGDCFTDDFPHGADCFLFAHFFTIWSEEKNRMLLRKCYDALAPGGTAIIFNMMQSDDETGPLCAAMGSPYFLTLATGEGMLYCWKEYETWLKEAGFRRVKIRKLPRDHGAIIGIKG